jgi:hypothetical protein
LTEIERLEKIAPINLEQLLKHLDPQRDLPVERRRAPDTRLDLQEDRRGPL